MPRRAAIVLVLCMFLPGQAAAQFFPPRVFSERADIQQFTDAWYSRHLSAMEEPPVWKAAEQKSSEIYRFIWLRTFHPPYAFRLIVRADGTGTLIAKNASGAGGYDPGRLTLNKTITLDGTHGRQFTAAIDQLGFWKLPTQEQRGPGFDGARWILEGVKGGRYHIVDRWTPDDGPYRKLLLELVALAGIKVDPIY